MQLGASGRNESTLEPGAGFPLIMRCLVFFISFTAPPKSVEGKSRPDKPFRQLKCAMFSYNLKQTAAAAVVFLPVSVSKFFSTFILTFWRHEALQQQLCCQETPRWAWMRLNFCVKPATFNFPVKSKKHQVQSLSIDNFRAALPQFLLVVFIPAPSVGPTTASPSQHGLTRGRGSDSVTDVVVFPWPRPLRSFKS